MNEVERIWTRSRERYGHPFGRRGPSMGITAILRALAEHGANYGSVVAVLARQNQGNTARWLVELERRDFVRRRDEVAGLGNQGGGRPAVFWALTSAGWELVRALAEGRVSV